MGQISNSEAVRRFLIEFMQHTLGNNTMIEKALEGFSPKHS